MLYNAFFTLIAGVHREVQSGENVNWKEEDLDFEFHFRLIIAQNFQTILQKICDSPGIVSFEGSQALFWGARIFSLPIIYLSLLL